MAINVNEAHNKSLGSRILALALCQGNVLTSKKYNFFIWLNGAQLIGTPNFRTKQRSLINWPKIKVGRT